jgi:preprotein translocase subunit SecD
MKFKNDKQRKAMFAKLNKFSCGCCGQDVCVRQEPVSLGVGERFANAIVSIYPDVPARSYEFAAEKPVASSIGDRLANAVVSMYPDVQQQEVQFSLDEYSSVGKEKFKKLKQDIDEAYGMGIYSDNEYKLKLEELKKKMV